ncbi:Oidioi.mRNA.OKI2018_I69.chr2.g5625.t1.cds [Oikopleura dioica]|uniref:Oidioi.mRNA.OKI2018_I69.chr2.g5625.t1.cds n=1 Tax=Oikopleura dioica TaxID=34765 RepID=A0ABN7T7H2_OIKDI|nr:Oidioi.mRNA.OKI2018_I69.chr2.g5625.t1.cds [Oikopleura dioica]
MSDREQNDDYKNDEGRLSYPDEDSRHHSREPEDPRDPRRSSRRSPSYDEQRTNYRDDPRKSPDDMDIEPERPESPNGSPRQGDRRNNQTRGSADFQKMNWKVVSRVLIPAKTAGSVIGIGGSTIKQLREEYGCSVMIPDSNSPERILTIRTQNYHLGGKVIGRCAEQLDEFLRKNIPIRLMVSEIALSVLPDDLESYCKSEWNADIRIMPMNCPFSTDRLIIIGGSPNAKGSSSGYILDTIHESNVDESNAKPYNPDRWNNSEYGGFGGSYMNDNLLRDQRVRDNQQQSSKPVQISAPQPVRDKFGRDQVWIKKFTLPSKYFIYIVGNAGARIEEIRKGTNTLIKYGPEQDGQRLIQTEIKPKMTETANTGLDSAYVKEQLGDVLTDLLSELVQVQPSDPIEWLANALRQHARAQSTPAATA